jgi:acetyltransferase
MPGGGETWRTRDGWEVLIRPIAPGDEAAWVAFVRQLSPATRHKRGGTRLEALTPALAHERVAPDPERELALVAVAARAATSAIVGVARCRRHDDARWEFMLVVADDWQRRSIGRRLMAALDAEMSRRGAPALEGLVLASNRGMLEFVERLGFRVEPSESGPMFRRAVKAFAAGTG